ncbi:MAG: FtsQ-type POTRA domain-containing protein [Bacilli bacterium]|nr:FtsQ-type POTRA domain-containing protein [Bacilli bacterium]
MTRKKRKKKRRLKIKNIIIFLIVILLFFGGSYYVIMMPVKNIYIMGNNILADEVIIEEAHLDKYPSFLLISSSKVKDNIKKNKFVNQVIIKKKFGNVLEIKVDEYVCIAVKDMGNKVMLSNGEMVDNAYNISDVAILNNDIPDNKRVDFANKFSKVNKDILRQISQIEYSPVKVDDERFLLYMDDGNIVFVTLTKINKLNKYNKIKGKLGGKIGIIYLDSGDYVEFKDNKAVVNENTEEKKEN